MISDLFAVSFDRVIYGYIYPLQLQPIPVLTTSWDDLLPLPSPSPPHLQRSTTLSPRDTAGSRKGTHVSYLRLN